MRKTRALATLTPDKAPVRRAGRGPARAEVESTWNAGPRPFSALIQRAAVPGATKSSALREAPRGQNRAEVNESADFAAAGVVPQGRGAAAGHVELVGAGAAYAPPPGMELRCFLHRDGTSVKFAGIAGGVYLGREQTHAEFGPLLGQAQALFQAHPVPGKPAAPKPAMVHREADGSAFGDAPSAVREAAASGGKPLDRGARTSLESSFGADLSGVRVHTDAAADRAAKAVHAHAFASGQDVYFRAGHYRPEAADGRRLLAHEVAHTVQQSDGVAASPAPGEVRLSEPGDRLEREAEAAAEHAVRGRRAEVRPADRHATGGALVAREVVSPAPPTRQPAPVKKPEPAKGAGTPPPRVAAPAASKPPPAAKDTPPKGAAPGAKKPPAQGEGKPGAKKEKEHAPAKGKPEHGKPKGKPEHGAGPAGDGAAAPDKAAAGGPEADAGLQHVVGKVHGVAAKHKVHPPAAAKAAEAQGAAHGPANEVAAVAAGRQVGTMDQQQPRPFDRDRFLATLLQEIDKTTPATLEQADDFKKQNKAGEVKGALTAQVGQGKAESQGNIAAATQARPDEAGIEPKPVAELKPPEGPAPAPDVNAAQAVPSARPESAVSLHAGSDALDQQMQSAGVAPETLAHSNEPAFQQALTTRDAARTHAEQAPKAYRAQEQGTLSASKAENVAAVQKQLGDLGGVRGKALGQVHGHQTATKGQDEQKRAEVVQKVQSIYDQTKGDVTGQLEQLDKDVDHAFDAGAQRAQQTFEDHVTARMAKFKEERYSGVDGWARWVADKLTSPPAEVNAFYGEGKTQYVKTMRDALGEIATLVEKGLTAAKARIAQGKREVETYVGGLDKSLRDVGREAAANIQAQFEQLEQSVDDKQNQIIDGLVERYKEKVQQLDERIAKMQEENKGLLDVAAAAVAGVLDSIANLKALLLGVLAKAGDAIDLIVKDPIGFLGNLVAGVKQGFLNFVGKIGSYLKQGLLDWLFGALAEAGLQMPPQLDLAGILSLVLQVLGLTYANIRRRAVKIVGEKVVSALETGAEIFITLITKGPAGLWEWIKDKASALIDSVLDGIKSFVMERVIMAGVTWIIGLLNPASAFVKACKAIYDIVMFFVERGQQILALVNAVLDSVTAIAKGSIGVAANFVEKALAKAVPVLIGFLAGLLGLGGISEKIKKIIEKIQEPVNAAIDWVIGKAVQMVKAVGKMLGFGKEKKDEDPEHAAKVQKGLSEMDVLDQTAANEGPVRRETAEKVANKVKADNPVFKSIKVVEGPETWDYLYTASADERHEGPKKEAGQLEVSTVKIDDAKLAAKVEQARHTSGEAYEEAVMSTVVKGQLVPEWEESFGVPIKPVHLGDKEFGYESREDLARLKVQRGHRFEGNLRRPETSMEVKKPGGGGALEAVVVVEITLVEDFSKHAGESGGKHSVRKADQFTYTVHTLIGKYGPQVPIQYHILTPQEPPPETQEFVIKTLQSQGAAKVQVKWIVVKTK